MKALHSLVKDAFTMMRYTGIAMFMVLVCTVHGQIAVCDGCMYQPFSRQIAFNDTLNARYPNTFSMGPGASGSTYCFIAHIEKIRQCSIASEFTETLSVVCDTQIRGPVLPKKFDVLNKYQRLWKQDCLASAQSLGAQKFLVTLNTPTVPNELYLLGVSVCQCSSSQGFFVTQSRIVTFYSFCFTTPFSCRDTAAFADLNTFLGKTEVLQPGRRNIVLSMPNRGVSRSGAFDIKGRLIYGNLRQTLRPVVKDNKVQIHLER
jgi:hypothetical protein